MACADRQLTALIGQDSKVGLVASAVVRLGGVAPGRDSPAGTGGDQVGAAVRVEVGRQDSGDMWDGRRALEWQPRETGPGGR